MSRKRFLAALQANMVLRSSRYYGDTAGGCWLPTRAMLMPLCSCPLALQDHLNDVMSNLCAILTALAAGFVPDGGWIDPAGAIAISVYIVVRWLAIAKQQVGVAVGAGVAVAQACLWWCWCPGSL